MKNKILLVCIGIILSLSSVAQDFQFFPVVEKERIYSYQIINNGSYKPATTYTDSLPVNVSNEYAALVANPSQTAFTIKSVQDFITIGINHDTAVVANAYNYKVSIRIWCYNYVAPTSPTAKDITLQITYHPDSGVSYTDANVFKFSGFHKLHAVVTNIVDANTNTVVSRSNLPKNFYIMSSISVQRYDNTTLSFSPGCSTINSGKTLRVSFNPNQTIKPVEYELEWQYIDDYQYDIYNGVNGSGGYKFNSGSTVAYDFRKNSTRIRTVNNYFDIPLTYEHGAIIYRVRTVRPDIAQDYRTLLYGAWNLSADVGTVNGNQSQFIYLISSPHTSDNLNWQYSINFAEGAKYKHVINYFDGSLRSRQTQTKINSDNDYVIAVDKTYDYEGRQALQTLPTPILQPTVDYNKDLAINSATALPYKASDFDGIGCALPDSFAPMSTTALANIYYSSLNTNKQLHQRFVPDGKGYPIIQTVYTPDNLLSWQGGAGYDHQLWTKHGSRYEHMGATQNELNGLFGGQVGRYEFYSKQVVTDPNGQSSFVIQNQNSQTIATGLIGMPDTINSPIDLLPSYASPVQECFDVLDSVKQERRNNSLSIDNPFYAEGSGMHSLQYRLKIPAFPVACSTAFLTAKGYYTYQVNDECGQSVIPNVIGSFGANAVQDINYTLALPGYSSALSESYLSKGKYVASKNLSFSRDEINTTVKNFVKANENNTAACYKNQRFFIKSSVEATAFPCVDSIAVIADSCDAKKRRMMSELWPGAKYGFYYQRGNGSFMPSTDCTGDSIYLNALFGSENSIFDGIDITPLGQPHGTCENPYPQYVVPRYAMNCITMPASVTKDGKVYTNIKSLPIDTFIYIFNDTIAEAILPLHPEYCKLAFCGGDDYTQKLEVNQTYKQALQNNRYYLDSIIHNDPLYIKSSAGDKAAMKTKLQYFTNFPQKKINEMAIEQAYCAAGNSLEPLHCSKYLYKTQIQSFVFIDSSIKERYYDLLRDFYLTNRSLVYQMTLDRSRSCEPCNGLRMNLSGTPVIEVVFNPSPYGNVLDTSMHVPAWMNSVFTNVVNNNTGSLTTAPTQLTDSINANKQAMKDGQIDEIMNRLANCSVSSGIMSQIRTNLQNYFSTNDVESLTPSVITSAITTGTGLSLNDLCHAFLVEYGLFDASTDMEYNYNCGTPELHMGLKNLLNRAQMVTLMKTATQTGSTASSFSLDASNKYENKIATKLSIAANATVTARSYLDTLRFVDPANSSNIIVVNYVRINIYATGGDTVKLHFKRKFSADPYLHTYTGTIATDNVLCINEDKSLANSGYISQFTAIADLSLNGSSQLTRYLVWSNSIAIMSPMEDAEMVNCVNCLDIKKAIEDFKTDKVTHAYDDAYDHPLFARTITNYLNYKLKKKHTYGEYLDLMKGCAVTDKVELPHHYATAKVVCTDSVAARQFIENVNSGFTTRDLVSNRIRYASGEVHLAFDLNGIPEDSLLAFKNRIWAFSSVSKTYLPAAPLSVLNKTNCTPANPLSVYLSPTTTTGVKLYVNGQYVDYNLYQFTGSYSNAKDHADKIAAANTFADQCGGAFVMQDAALFRSADYARTDKQAYLTYIYGLSNTSRYEIADSISESNLSQRVTGYSGNTLSYDDPQCSKSKRDLYINTGSQTSHPGYKRLTDSILTKVTTALSGGLFLPTGTLSASTASPDLKVYRKANGVHWYRFFNPTLGLFNVHVQPPANPPLAINTLILDSVRVGPGNDSLYKFTAYMHYSSLGSEVVVCKGYADFPVGYGRKVANVVLRNKPGLDYCLDSVDCEYGLLQDAIYAGKVRYQQYFDSVTTTLTDSMLLFLVNNTKDSLYLCTRAHKDQVTLYYYDLSGNLVKTVPPAGYNKANPNSNSKASIYKYDSRNLLIYQKTPDGGITEFYYDRAGRLVFSQNSKQRGAAKYSYTSYDGRGRIIETGEFAPICGNNCTMIKNAAEYTNADLQNYVCSNIRTEVVATHYDVASKNLSSEGYNLTDQENLSSRVAAILFYDSRAANSCGSPLPAPQFGTYYSYDMVGNVKRITYEYGNLGMVGQKFKYIDYDFDQISGKVNMLSYNRGHSDQFYQKYSYDADNRIIEVNTSNDGVIWNSDARYTYYAHGPLANVKLGANQLQSIDYAYTIQGWLKAINGDVLRPDKDMGQNGAAGDRSYARDVIAMSLNYFKNDYKTIDNTVAVTNLPEPEKGLYNGNIARQTMSLNKFGNLQRNYRYDQAQRLKLATYAAVDETNLTVATPSNIFKNSYAYDADGNMQNLTRYDNTGTKMDSIIYSYTTNTNMLALAKDQVGATTAPHDVEAPSWSVPSNINYKYDSLGNMVKDIYANQNVEWNLYGKVRTMIDTVTKEIVKYYYDGMGNRVHKTVTNKVSQSAMIDQGEYYVNDPSGNILASYNFTRNYSPYLLIKATNNGLHTNSTFLSFLQTSVMPYGTFGTMFITKSIASNPAWVNTYLSGTPVSYYLDQDDGLYENLLMNTQTDYFDAMINHDKTISAPSPPPSTSSGHYIGYAIIKNTDRGRPLLEEIFAQPAIRQLALTHFDRVMYMFTTRRSQLQTIWTSRGLSYTATAYSTNATTLSNFLTTNPAQIPAVISQMINHFNTVDAGSSDPRYTAWFYCEMSHDPAIFQAGILRNPAGSGTPYTPFEESLATALYETTASAVKGRILPFFDSWVPAVTWLNANTTLTQRFTMRYNANPSAAVSSFITNTSNYTLIDSCIYETTDISAEIYYNLVKAHATLGPLSTANLQSGLAADTLALAAHHLYGASKLGVQYYNAVTGQPNNTWHHSSGIGNTQLSNETPWHSGLYADLIVADELEPWGNDFTDSFRVKRTLGYRWYDITDHLGNVVAVLKDRKTGHKASPSDQVYSYWKPDLADLTDYYPFGMKMPGRLTLSENQYGYNGQRSEREIYSSVAGNLGNYDVHYTFKAREYDPRLGRFWSRDPLFKKYPAFSAYSFVGNNPIVFSDPSGKDLQLGGNQSLSLDDIRSLVPAEYRAQINMVNDKVVFNDYNSLPEEIKSYEGVSLLNNMISSSKQYRYSVGNSIIGTRRTDGKTINLQAPSKNTTPKNTIVNLSTTARTDLGMDEPGNFLPESGIDGSVLIGDGTFERQNQLTGTGSHPYERNNVVFHELGENYERTEGGKDKKGMDYLPAHEKIGNRGGKFSKEINKRKDVSGGTADYFIPTKK